MADIINSAVKFHYGSLSKYEAKRQAGGINANDVYFVVADGDENSELLQKGFLYLNGVEFGGGVVDVSVSDVIDSSFRITVSDFDVSKGILRETTKTIFVPDANAYDALSKRLTKLEQKVEDIDSSINIINSSITILAEQFFWQNF